MGPLLWAGARLSLTTLSLAHSTALTKRPPSAHWRHPAARLSVLYEEMPHTRVHGGVEGVVESLLKVFGIEAALYMQAMPAIKKCRACPALQRWITACPLTLDGLATRCHPSVLLRMKNSWQKNWRIS